MTKKETLRAEIMAQLLASDLGRRDDEDGSRYFSNGKIDYATLADDADGVLEFAKDSAFGGDEE
jgi:hypothetical protein